MIEKYDSDIENTKNNIETAQKNIETEKAAREDPKNERQSKKDKIKELKSQNEEIEAKIAKYELTDPKKVKEVQDRVKVAKDSANRWTDNLFELQSWMRDKNPNCTSSDLEKQFPILKDLDNID